jgi:hypothetical protein
MTSHLDINDPLDDLLRDPIDLGIPRPMAPHTPKDFRPVTERLFDEPCEACRGTGRWQGTWKTGRCFKCDGTGRRQFKTSPEQRAAGRESRIRGELRRTQEQADARTTWIAEHKAEYDWLNATVTRYRAQPNGDNLEGFQGFLADLLDKLNHFGHLTDGQLAAVRNSMARDAARETERAERKAAAPTVDISKIEQAFATAERRAFEKNPNAMGVRVNPLKLRAEGLDLIVNQGSRGTSFEGKLFVKTSEGKKLGWIEDSKFHAKFECTKVEAKAVVQACSDPHRAAKTWAQAYSQCGVCGQRLTNPASIEEGIGPICAEKYGW